jgi:hypothetical protein
LFASLLLSPAPYLLATTKEGNPAREIVLVGDWSCSGLDCPFTFGGAPFYRQHGNVCFYLWMQFDKEEI